MLQLLLFSYKSGLTCAKLFVLPKPSDSRVNGMSDEATEEQSCENACILNEHYVSMDKGILSRFK